MAKKTSKADDDLLKLAKDHFAEGSEAWEDNREASEDDFRMLDGQQWDEISLQDREGRPSLVINKLSGVQKQITGDQRQNRPSIKIQPVDSEADPEVAEILTGLIRNIEQQSDAESAYDTAFEQCSGGGYGFFRVNTEYATEDAFDQDIVIERILDPFSVTVDPYAKRQDKADARYTFVEETIPLSEFEAEWPDAVPVSWETEYADDSSNWYTKEHVRIAEYYYTEKYTKLLYQLESGEVVNAEDVKGAINTEVVDGKEVKFLVDAQTGEPVRIVKEREAICDRVKWIKMTGHAILEKSDWIGKYIPIVGVWGDERWVDGYMIYKSAIRDGKDAQKIYNWMRSTSVETVSQAPRQPYMISDDQIDGLEDEWDDMHTVPKPYLKYNHVPGMPPPIRIGGSVPDIGAQHESAIAADDIKSTTGIYDASLGKQGTATSGIQEAYQQRKGDTATFVYVDNLTRALRHTGRILVDLIPRIYDTQRVVRVLGEDGAEDFQEVNKTVLGPNQEPIVLNDLARGKYDVVVSTGPAYSTQRIESAEAMMNFAQMVPAFGENFIDLIASSQDWPNADEIAKRAQKLLPPGLLERDEKDLSPEEQQAIQQQRIQQEQEQKEQDMMKQIAFSAAKVDLENKQLENAKLKGDILTAAETIKKTQAETEGQHLDNTQTEIEIQTDLGAIKPVKEQTK